jgi:hypothetical protein
VLPVYTERPHITELPYFREGINESDIKIYSHNVLVSAILHGAQLGVSLGEFITPSKAKFR